MKYHPTRELESLTNTLNFDTADCHVTGSLDLYTTKAAGQDKKLYKNIEEDLESQYTSLVRLSDSMSPPNRELVNLHISNSSPFGPMSQKFSRRTFAYLIATMNASHPDYDFSGVVKPSDFTLELNLDSVMQTIDETMRNLRPKMKSQLLAPPSRDSYSYGTMYTPGGTPVWSPRAWKSIDKELALRECEMYQFSPAEDPFDPADCSIWQHHFFFYNKQRKRVLYFYLTGASALSHSSPSHATVLRRPKRPRPPSSQNLAMSDPGATKRAKYWLGDRVTEVEDGWKYLEDEDDQFYEVEDDEVDTEEALVEDDGFDDYEDAPIDDLPRAMSEHVVETLEL